MFLLLLQHIDNLIKHVSLAIVYFYCLQTSLNNERNLSFSTNMPLILFSLLSLLSVTASPMGVPERITDLATQPLLKKYLNGRKEQILRCVANSRAFVQEMNGKNVTVVFGPSSMTLLGVRY
jgi:hypothetical protein